MIAMRLNCDQNGVSKISSCSKQYNGSRRSSPSESNRAQHGIGARGMWRNAGELLTRDMIAGWASTYGHPLPRRSHDQSRPEISVARSPTPDQNTAEPRRRSSSDATPRQTPAPSPRLFPSSPASTVHDPNVNILSNPLTDAVPSTSAAPSSRRLGYLAEKISSSLSSGHSTIQKSASSHSQLLHPHSGHTKADSVLTARDQAGSPSPMASSTHLASSGKSHTSPSKVRRFIMCYLTLMNSRVRLYMVAPMIRRSFQRRCIVSAISPTYLACLRLYHRLHRLHPLLLLLQAVYRPHPSAPPPLLILGQRCMSTYCRCSMERPCGSQCTYLTRSPPFSIYTYDLYSEDLNVLVRQHIEKVIPLAPSKTLSTLENHTADLISSGMVTLNAKLSGIDDEKLVSRVVEIWNFFWDQVLPYVEGVSFLPAVLYQSEIECPNQVLLPLQTDALLSSLYRAPKAHRSSSPGRQPSKGSISTSSNVSMHSSSHIDVRSVALRSFRDRVILPIFERLYKRLSNKQDLQETSAHHQPRLQQM